MKSSKVGLKLNILLIKQHTKKLESSNLKPGISHENVGGNPIL